MIVNRESQCSLGECCGFFRARKCVGFVGIIIVSLLLVRLVVIFT